MTALTGIPGPLLVPGSPEWLQTISASKIASIMGLNPWTSRFTLWHRMAGNIVEPQTDEMRRGHYLEPAILAWLEDQHDLLLDDAPGTWRHREHEWATANPDALLGIGDDVRLVEVKSSAVSDDWGTAGTDEIPPGYRAQVQWQMFVTGARTTHVAVLLPYLEFREYVVEYDEAYAAVLFDAAVEFRASLTEGRQPPLDGADDTYLTVRALHPDIEDVDAEIDPSLANEWLNARSCLNAWEITEQQYRARLVNAMGNAHYATCNGWKLGDRRAKSGGVPYFQPARTLPTYEQVHTPREDTAA